MGPPVIALRVFREPRFSFGSRRGSTLHPLQPPPLSAEQMPQLESIVLGQEATGTRSQVRLSQETLSVSTFYQETLGSNHGAVAES